MKRFYLLIALMTHLLSVFASELPLNLIQLPQGFNISLYARVPGARSLTRTPEGVVFVGTRAFGKVYALLPDKKFTKAKRTVTVIQNLNMPNGVAYKDGSLFVAEIHRIIQFKDILSHLHNPHYRVIYDKLPHKKHHGWRYIGIGPDNWLYVSIGAPCNVCEKNEPYATISKLKLDGSDFQSYAKGVRNSVGFDWSPDKRQLWFTDNGRDWLGDNKPPDELNYAPRAGMHFGFPYFWGDNQPDKVHGKYRTLKGMTPPALALGPHVAALGMRFYTGKMFPPDYHNQIFIAEHGSWNRRTKIGYRLIAVKLNSNQAVSKKIFASGWLKEGKVFGRPVDVLVMPDGALLVSDDYAGAVYRISYGRDA